MTVLDTVLGTDVEREKLMKEEKELEKLVDNEKA